MYDEAGDAQGAVLDILAAKIAVSSETLRKARFLLKHAPATLIHTLREGEAKISGTYEHLRGIYGQNENAVNDAKQASEVDLDVDAPKKDRKKSDVVTIILAEELFEDFREAIYAAQAKGSMEIKIHTRNKKVVSIEAPEAGNDDG